MSDEAKNLPTQPKPEDKVGNTKDTIWSANSTWQSIWGGIIPNFCKQIGQANWESSNNPILILVSRSFKSEIGILDESHCPICTNGGGNLRGEHAYWESFQSILKTFYTDEYQGIVLSLLYLIYWKQKGK